MKVAAIIQARMGSKRLPGKVLAAVSKRPVLYHVIERVREAQCIDAIILATTVDPEDKILLKRAREFQVHGYAGPEHDIIKRFIASAQLVNADVIVRVTCDNPLVEPSYIDDCVVHLTKQMAEDKALQKEISKSADKDADKPDGKKYYCYVDGAALGTGVDVFTKEALELADKEATKPQYREHIVTWFKDNPDKITILTIPAQSRYTLPDLRLTIDEDKDIDLIRQIYHKFYREETIVPLNKVVGWLRENPEIAGLNADVIQKAPTESEIPAHPETEPAEEIPVEESLEESETAPVEEEKPAIPEETQEEETPEPLEETIPEIAPEEEQDEEAKSDDEVTWEKLFGSETEPDREKKDDN